MEEEPSAVVIAGPNSSNIKDMIAAVNDDCATIYPEEEEESETYIVETQTTNGNIYFETELVSEGETKVVSATDRASRKSFRAASYDSSAASEHRVPTSKSLVSIETCALNDVHNDETNEAVDLALEEYTESKKKSKTKVLNRVAKTVKSSTVITGKQVLKQSKKVGKATVNTGRAAG
jgi:acetyl-CoA acetyltransferase